MDEGAPLQELIFDPQTSGGLLIAVAANRAAALVSDLHANGDTRAAVIGRIVAGPGARVTWT
jgi:selenide,water dikinase